MLDIMVLAEQVRRTYFTDGVGHVKGKKTYKTHVRLLSLIIGLPAWSVTFYAASDRLGNVRTRTYSPCL